MSDELNRLRGCSCQECVKLCRKNPGWMTPFEAAAAIKAGLAHRLMKDWLEPDEKLKNENRIYVLAPASLGHEGGSVPEFEWSMLFSWCKGQCTFLKDGLCEIHVTNFKPKQCCENMGCSSDGLDNSDMARFWNTEEGKEVVAFWEKCVAD